MTFVNAIEALRDRTLLDLRNAHDYYESTIIAWKVVRMHVASGQTLTDRNPTTGKVLTLTDIATRARDYVAIELAAATFQQFIAIFESFLFDFLRTWLTAYPQNLFGRKVDFREVFGLPDLDALTQVFVNKELNEILYDRPTQWFDYLERTVRLGCPTQDEVERFAEAKATRDVLAHNRGVVGKTYAMKAGRFARFKTGERIDLPEPYHRETWTLLGKMVADIADAAMAKVT